MAQKVIIDHVDDLDGKSPADETGVHFGLDGVDYEIDLSAANAQRLRDALGEYVGAGRRTGGRKQRSGSGRVTARIATNGDGKPDAKEIRKWAATHGVELAPRGRIPQGIVDMYLDDHA